MAPSPVSTSEKSGTTPWGLLSLIVLAAGVIRVYFMTGFQGTDDLIFAKVAHNIAHGNLTPGTYIGTLRYGFNLPLAAATVVLGFNEFALTAYPLIASLATIVILYFLGEHLFGRAVGLLAATLTAFCTLDVIWAGRIQADAPLLMLMTWSCLLFLKAINRKEDMRAANRLLFMSGVLLGVGYTTKNVAIFLWPLFAFLAWYCAIGLFRLLWAASGFLAVFAAESAFFLWQTGDPLYTFTVQALHNKKVAAIVSAGSSEDLLSWPLAYPYWAFFGLQHVGLTFYLAAVAYAGYLLVRNTSMPVATRPVVVLLAWFLSVLAILTFYVMSWDPFVLIWKQPNYMLMFLPPVLILTAAWLMAMPLKWRSVAVACYAGTSLLFAGVEREVLAAESANARAAAQWYLEEGREQPVYCGVRDCGMVAMFTHYGDESKLIPYDDPFRNVAHVVDLSRARSGAVVVNQHWLKRSVESISHENRRLIASPPSDWKLIRVFKHESHGVLYWGTKLLLEGAERGWAPQPFVRLIERKVREAVEPDPLRIYQVGESVEAAKTS
ncbi:ArnT family glycosyltransferase [Nitrospira moscoviensis]|uniref:Glycosyltransferase RgtA/B/C/D-like domain-containing protein n=1 Tax=Nitrospira moscoviensis TaxID=42253 RepID=A0A0K2GGM0_NITMO|nr:glycosyltransferase family 39 protein [Nitrospira moscoviensis]ALA59767.1 membrane protein of unknown function [Nitrospira moscoviensis]